MMPDKKPFLIRLFPDNESDAVEYQRLGDQRGLIARQDEKAGRNLLVRKLYAGELHRM